MRASSLQVMRKGAGMSQVSCHVNPEIVASHTTLNILAFSDGIATISGFHAGLQKSERLLRLKTNALQNYADKRPSEMTAELPG